MTTIHDRLGDLADTADTADLADTVPRGAADADLWTLGRRQHRRRQVGAFFAGAAVLVLVVGLGAVWGLRPSTDRTTPPADVPFGELHLPRLIHVPGKWAPGTDDAGLLGPLAAIGMGTRAQPKGLTGVSEHETVFGVSAVDGTVRWLDLPDGRRPDSGFAWLALSPDGTKVGYTVSGPEGVKGWAVYDATTGETVQLRDPEQPVIAGTDMFEIEFSGDSRYLQTNYSPTGSNRSRDGQFVVWDVETGDPTVVEGPGHYWLPSLGSAPREIVWSRKHEVFRWNVAAGGGTTTSVPHQVVEWSDGPGAESAYIAFGERQRDPWRLFSGDGRPIAVDIDPGYVLGWRDARTVVVADLRYKVRYVDVRTGETVGSERLRVADEEMQNVFVTPEYASGLWANEVVDGVEPPEFADRRVDPSDTAKVVGPALALALVGWLLWRRRVRP